MLNFINFNTILMTIKERPGDIESFFTVVFEIGIFRKSLLISQKFKVLSFLVSKNI